MTTGNYALVYPTRDVSLEDLTRAALAVVGVAYVTVVSGAGSQALRIPEDSVERVQEFAVRGGGGGEPAPADTGADSKPASGPDEESPGPDAPKATAAPSTQTKSARPGSRPARKATAKKAAKKATSSRSTSAQKKEGDDQ